MARGVSRGEAVPAFTPGATKTDLAAAFWTHSQTNRFSAMTVEYYFALSLGVGCISGA